MADGQKRDEDQAEKQDGLTDEQRAAKLRRIKASQRAYYLRNKHWILEEARVKREEARKKRRKRRKPKKPKPTREELQRAAEERQKAAEKRAAARQRASEEWKELGWVVAKMNKTAKLSQQQIYELLGGLASKKKIAAWCARGKKLDRIRPPK